MAAARTVIAFPRVSYYPCSTTPFIHGDDAGRVVVYGSPRALSSSTPAIRRPFRRLLSFTSTSTMSNGCGNSRRNMAGSVSHWSMTMGVRRLDHHGLFVRGIRVCDQVCRSCSCRCMQEENLGRFLPRLSARLATQATRDASTMAYYDITRARHPSWCDYARDARQDPLL